jgi:hypothetical protein
MSAEALQCLYFTCVKQLVLYRDEMTALKGQHQEINKFKARFGATQARIQSIKRRIEGRLSKLGIDYTERRDLSVPYTVSSYEPKSPTPEHIKVEDSTEQPGLIKGLTEIAQKLSLEPVLSRH